MMKIGRLLLMNGEETGKSFLLKNLSVFEAGRSPGNHILIKDSSVAMSHFRICRNGNEYSIYDLGSKQGTLVNDSPVEKAVLAPGDVIQAGALRIRFDLVDEGTPGRLASSAPEFESLASIAREEVRKQTTAVAEMEEDGPVMAEPVPCLVVVAGEDQGKVFPLVEKKSFHIGRTDQSDFRLRDGKVSRDHCVVEQVLDSFVIADQESANGVIINGERVKKTVLKEGDYIRLGYTILQFQRLVLDDS